LSEVRSDYQSVGSYPDGSKIDRTRRAVGNLHRTLQTLWALTRATALRYPDLHGDAELLQVSRLHRKTCCSPDRPLREKPKGTEYHLLANASYFALLAPCTAGQTQGNPDICLDAPGFDRITFRLMLRSSRVSAGIFSACKARGGTDRSWRMSKDFGTVRTSADPERSSLRQKTGLAEPFLNAMRGFLRHQFGDIET
jgi:hypothetical protein